MENGELKAYGSALVSSESNLSKLFNSSNGLEAFNPFHAAISNSNSADPKFVANNVGEVKEKVTEYLELSNRPFTASYNNTSNSIEVNRKIKTRTCLDA